MESNYHMSDMTIFTNMPLHDLIPEIILNNIFLKKMYYITD